MECLIVPEHSARVSLLQAGAEVYGTNIMSYEELEDEENEIQRFKPQSPSLLQPKQNHR